MDDFSDGEFAFIVGYTSGGAPYGIHHEETDGKPPQEFPSPTSPFPLFNCLYEVWASASHLLIIRGGLFRFMYIKVLRVQLLAKNRCQPAHHPGEGVYLPCFFIVRAELMPGS